MQENHGNNLVDSGEERFYYFGMCPIEKPEFTLSAVDSAGRALRDWWKDDSNLTIPSQFRQWFRVINNWNSAHQFPKQVFLMTLRRRARRIDPKSIVVSRTKNIFTTMDKLEREHTRLTQMQDIAGCRAIINSIESLYELANEYKSKRTPDFSRDYIARPDSLGYRGIHYVYRYSGSVQDYSGLKVELQFRTRVQHRWATAVEMTDWILAPDSQTNGRLKYGDGDPEWQRFFVLMASFLAIKENCQRVPGTPDSLAELKASIRRLEATLRVRQRMGDWVSMMRAVFTEDKNTRNQNKYLLVFDPDTRETHVTGFSAKHADKAFEELRIIQEIILQSPESKLSKTAILAEGSDLNEIKQAFPGYSVDANGFLEEINDALS